jgi:hypothetical protein
MSAPEMQAGSAQPGSGAAVRACQEYERWASEVRRLTEAIGAVVCPREVPDEDLDPMGSHFSEASDIRTDTDNWRPDYAGPRRLNLSEIEDEDAVADCPACSRLCALIRERRHARKQFGIAKRRVRSVGKALTPP